MPAIVSVSGNCIICVSLEKRAGQYDESRNTEMLEAEIVPAVKFPRELQTGLSRDEGGKYLHLRGEVTTRINLMRRSPQAKGSLSSDCEQNRTEEQRTHSPHR